MEIWNHSYPEYKEFYITKVSDSDLLELKQFINNTTQEGIELIENGNYTHKLFPNKEIDKIIYSYNLYIKNSEASLLFKLQFNDIIFVMRGPTGPSGSIGTPSINWNIIC